MESPTVRHVLMLLSGQGLKIDIDQASYFLGREKLIVGTEGEMSRWRAHLFVFLSRNAEDASAYFGIPEDRAIEVGIRLHV
jgi:KUP system potassium uptake protein